MQVPFLDLRAQHEPLREALARAIEEVIDGSAFAGGPFVARFEEDFAAFCGSPNAIGLGTGTEALWLALLALGVGPGDEVITVPSTFMATAEAITYCGATPVFVDIEETTYTMNPALLERAITNRTKAIIPVHLYGQMADMDPILEIARKHSLPVIEDACQAHGAEYKGRKAGTFGVAGCFSFYPGKNLGALGEAGAVVTGNVELRDKIKMFRDHGQRTKYYHSEIGWNARMDGIQAAALRVKLPTLALGNQKRRQLAGLYDGLLAGIEGVQTPVQATNRLHVYHLYVIRTRQRDDLIRELAEKGIACGIHYPIPVHLQDAYKSLGLARGSFPVSERCASEVASLPMFPELAIEQVEMVCREVKAWARKSRSS